jgi:hypothetical protein
MIGYAETVHGPIGLRQRGAMSGATVPASSPPVTGRHRAHARGTPASWCPPPNDRGRALTRISANLVARGCKGIYVPACAVKYPTLLLRPLSRSSSGLCVGGLPARGWWCGVCPSPRWILTPRRYSPKCLEGVFSEVAPSPWSWYLGDDRSGRELRGKESKGCTYCKSNTRSGTSKPGRPPSTDSPTRGGTQACAVTRSSSPQTMRTTLCSTSSSTARARRKPTLSGSSAKCGRRGKRPRP